VPQGARLAAYRDAMADLVAAEPADTEAAIFHALAMVASADPTDKSYAGQRAAGSTLERLFARMPDHPGLAHYIIHSYDVPPLADKALRAADRYSRIAPAISHALHMPSHTYTRVGLWERSIFANVSAADAARREGATAEELHATDYRMYAHLQLAQDSAATRILGSLATTASRLNLSAIGTGGAPAAGYYALAAIPARYALEREAWVEAAKLTVTPSPVPFADAVTWFARALGAARTGDVAVADSAITKLQALRDLLARSGEVYWTDQVEIQRRVASAWRASAAGQEAEGLAEMRHAADREDATEKNAITPGPLAPARELLGEMLLAAHQPARALVAFETALRHEPNRFRTIALAARAATAAGNRTVARAHYAALLELGAGADRPVRPELAEAARVLGR
jgi:tetratricopeptide (TPR) repeat protein